MLCIILTDYLLCANIVFIVSVLQLTLLGNDGIEKTKNNRERQRSFIEKVSIDFLSDIYGAFLF